METGESAPPVRARAAKAHILRGGKLVAQVRIPRE